MSNDELTDALSDKMRAEQTQFREELLKMPPEDILNNAYDYWAREDIILAAEEQNLSDAQLSALLKLENPLKETYRIFQDTERDMLEPALDSLERLADAELRSGESRREPERLSIREQLKAGTSRAAPERTEKTSIQTR